ncbi:Cytidine deaminase [Brachybacterium faecium]|uniref:Cytidine deaminase n=1 Tax=Brachybacterium faecium (strain ATCC 43885 / DSM 4810 / JCM 11609 / LMG 19847 / NBRC 14762 / NCIMB 9860 / 6-10) TaxID=446465 RepID=C7MEC4_BRAFD|nr:cytidine deaminase [Brachybacterium faecium]ACU85931.1 cytidine deaminase [Brachybacterium faecium DSM 4810]SLM99083.1 Cytidine deaminase [Brachybacterium faecium]HJG52873.1 cytidine deaminase [Brachybacterium faecium]
MSTSASLPPRARAAEAEPEFAPLLAAAREIAERAYTPYSRFRVGAAGLTEDGRLVRGCNVENAGYGVTLCAECGMISELIAGGGGKLRRFVCVGGDEQLGREERAVVMPCGRCRQLLSEHAAPDLVVLTPEGPRSMDAVLPQAFGPADLRP